VKTIHVKPFHTTLVKAKADVGILKGGYILEDTGVYKDILPVSIGECYQVAKDGYIYVPVTNHGQTSVRLADRQALGRVSKATEAQLSAVQENINKPTISQYEYDISNEWSEEDRKKFSSCLKEFDDIFTEIEGGPNWGLKILEEYWFKVDLKPDAKPSFTQPGRKSPQENEHWRKINEKRLNAGLIEKSTSGWGARAVLATKKDGKPREVINFYVLNHSLIPEQYPIPHQDDVLDFLGDGKGNAISELDALSGYWQLRAKDSS